MSPETWSAVFAGATFVVIAAAAIAALVQLRHLRASNQLNTLLSLMQMWNAPDLQEHIAYVRGALQEQMRDPDFLSHFETGSLSRKEHPELFVADFWELVGSFIKYRLMDERSTLDVASPQITNAWDRLEPAIRTMRRRRDPAMFENFEFVAVRARLWQRRHPRGNWPSGLPRIEHLKAVDDAKQAAR